MKDTEKFKTSKKTLDLQENVEGIYLCRGLIEGSYPVFVPLDSLLAEKLIFAAQSNSLQWAVVLTIGAYLGSSICSICYMIRNINF